jgi:hypothetical protein
MALPWCPASAAVSLTRAPRRADPQWQQPAVLSGVRPASSQRPDPSFPPGSPPPPAGPIKVTASLFIAAPECTPNLTDAAKASFTAFLAAQPDVDVASINAQADCTKLVGPGLRLGPTLRGPPARRRAAIQRAGTMPPQSQLLPFPQRAAHLLPPPLAQRRRRMLSLRRLLGSGDGGGTGVVVTTSVTWRGTDAAADALAANVDDCCPFVAGCPERSVCAPMMGMVTSATAAPGTTSECRSPSSPRQP